VGAASRQFCSFQISSSSGCNGGNGAALRAFVVPPFVPGISGTSLDWLPLRFLKRLCIEPRAYKTWQLPLTAEQVGERSPVMIHYIDACLCRRLQP